MMEEMGEGAYGVVYRVTFYDGTVRALKVIKDLHTVLHKVNRMVSEMEILRTLEDEDGKTPYYLAIPSHLVYVEGLDVTKVAFVMPYLDGEELFSLVKGPGLNHKELTSLAIDLLSAVAYMASRGMVHRDIKPENIFTSESDFILIDFDFACLLDDCHDKRGTPSYFAPEILSTKTYRHRFKWSAVDIYYGADVWSAGITLFTAATKYYPYRVHKSHPDMDDVARIVQEKMKAGNVTLIDETNDSDLAVLPREIVQVISKALTLDPAHRPTAIDLLRIIDHAAAAKIPPPLALPEFLTWTTNDITPRTWIANLERLPSDPTDDTFIFSRSPLIQGTLEFRFFRGTTTDPLPISVDMTPSSIYLDHPDVEESVVAFGASAVEDLQPFFAAPNRYSVFANIGSHQIGVEFIWGVQLYEDGHFQVYGALFGASHFLIELRPAIKKSKATAQKVS